MKRIGMIVAISITAATLLSASIIVFAETAENKKTEIAYTESSENSKVISNIDNVEIPENFKDFEPNSDEDKIKAEMSDKISNSSEIEVPFESENKTEIPNQAENSTGTEMPYNEDLDANYNEDEEKDNKNDLKAYEILSKYKGAEYARTNFITDYDLDLSYMREIVKLIESGKLSKSEEDILHKYVSRRAYWITDKAVSTEFEKWILG